MPAIDINRTTSNVVLPREVSNDIWTKTIEESAVMQLAERVDLPGAGVEFQMITGDPEASWVGETEERSVGTHSFGSKLMKGYTLAVIEPFSNQFRRDARKLYDELVRRLPKALGRKFDQTVFGFTTRPGDLFDQLSSAASVTVGDDIWTSLVTADASVAAGDGILDGWAVNPAMKSKLLTARDTVGRPLFIDSMATQGEANSLMGNRCYVRKSLTHPTDNKFMGFAGDWSSAKYGIVEDIKIDISDQATLTVGEETINLWQRDMFAVKVQFEVGFRVSYMEHFVKLATA